VLLAVLTFFKAWSDIAATQIAKKIVLLTLENLFFPKLRKKFAAPPKSITNDVCFAVLEGSIHFVSDKLVRAHFHFYIIYGLENEMVSIINCLDSSNKFITHKMNISFQESGVDIICDWFGGSHKFFSQLWKKKVL
jgi:hypothetical protein